MENALVQAGRNSLPKNREAATDPLLNNKEVAALYGIKSVVTVWRYVKAGIIPPPLVIGGTRRWPRSEIIASIERAKAARPVAA